MACGRQRWAGPFAGRPFYLIDRDPLRAVVDWLVIDDEPAVITDRLDTVRVNEAATFRTVVAGPFSGGDVLVERLFVDVSY